MPGLGLGIRQVAERRRLLAIVTPTPTPAPGPTITGLIAAGDSITQGYPNYSSSPPTLFANDTGLPVLNKGVDGNKIQDLINRYQADVVANYSASAKNRVLTCIGINDILTGTSSTAYVTGKIMEIHNLNVAAGIPSDFGTLTPCGPSYNSNFNESIRLAVNDFIRSKKADGTFSLVVDFANDSRLQDPTNATYYSDQLHFTVAGNQVRSDIMRAAYGLTGAVSPTLQALTLTPNTATVGTAYSGTIGGKTASSTIALINGAGLAVSGTSVTGTPTAAGSLGLTETLAGATNSPRTTSGVATIAAATPTPTPTGVTFTKLAGNTTASTLSNGDKTFKGNGAPGNTPRAAAITSLPIVGKMLFAASFDSNATNGEKRFGLIGVSTTRVTSGGSGFDPDSACLFTDLNQMFVSGNGGPNIPGPVIGENQAMYVDLAAAKLWYTKDGTNWYGTAGPLTLAQVNAGTSGVDISTAKAQGTLYFVVGERDQTGFQWTALQAWPFAANTKPTGSTYIGDS